MKCSMINTTGIITMNCGDALSDLCKQMVAKIDQQVLKGEKAVDLFGNLYAFKLSWLAKVSNTTVNEMLRECGIDSQKYKETNNGIYSNSELLEALAAIENTERFEKLAKLTWLLVDRWWENPLQENEGIKSLATINENIDYRSFQAPMVIACIEKYNFNPYQLSPQPTKAQLDIREKLESQNEGHLPVTIDVLLAVQDTYDVPLRMLMLIPDDVSFYGYDPATEVLFQKIKLLSNEKQKIISDLAFQLVRGGGD